MAQKNRQKDIWLIPKRVNLHQTICLIDGIIARKYDGTSWGPQKQNNLGVNLKNWGATKDGKNISQQAIRTLVASIPQYLGFVYINTLTTPNTICITEVGYKLWKKHIADIVKIDNLVDGNKLTIKESDIVLEQLEKLIITNPIIAKDCENILLFPFRFMLRVLLDVEYLDQEEIAYILFKVRYDDELELVKSEIQNFRNLSIKDRKKLITEFKKTHIGNITLVKAASSGYFMSLCLISGILEKVTIKPQNLENKISALKIKNQCLPLVKNIVDVKYKNILPYDFKDNLLLWVDYIGNSKHLFPPREIKIINPSVNDYLIQVFRDNICLYCDLIGSKSCVLFPMFSGDEYEIKLFGIEDGQSIFDKKFVPTFSDNHFMIDISDDKTYRKMDIADYIVLINEHCKAKNFSVEILNRLNVITKITGIDKTSDKYLRGALLEYYFFRLLSILKDENIISDVVWNGKIGRFGLPVSAPGGKTGTPDIVFKIDNYCFILELTTIQPKAMQFSSEGSSVPDHIKIYKKKDDEIVFGIFAAPIQHQRNVAVMQAAMKNSGIELKCITIENFLYALARGDKKLLLDYLIK